MRPPAFLQRAGLVALGVTITLASASSNSAGPYASLPATSPIQDLTATPDFDAALLRAGRQTPLLLVHIHGRCSSCQAVAPAFVAAAERAGRSEGADVVLRDVSWGRVDGRANEALMERYGVQGNNRPLESASDGPKAAQGAESAHTGSGPGSIPGYPILAFSKPSAEPAVLTLDDGGGADVDAKAEAILRFARDQIRLLSPVKSSAAVLEAVAKERVLALNADSFHGVVLSEEKDVLVEFYAPWCSHCKKLAPRYAKVAKLFAEHPTCLVTTFNADPPAERAIARDHKIRGFPTLKFYPSKTNTRTNWTKAEPEVYRGPRTPEALVAFLNERCGTELELPTWQEAWAPTWAAWKARLGLGGGQSSAAGEGPPVQGQEDGGRGQEL